MTLGAGNLINSYWYALWLTAENGHGYFAITTLSQVITAGEGINSCLSLLDIDTEEYYGRTDFTPGTLSNTTYDISNKVAHQYSTKPDLVSVQHAETFHPCVTMNLTLEPRGPNLYHAGSGIHWFGGGITHEIASPQLWVTGSINVNGTDVAVIPEESVGWLDRQWGPGAPTKGWDFYTIYLSNGWSMSVWHVSSTNLPLKLSRFATVLFPNGHTEVHTLEDDIHPTGPWVSPVTNLTYHNGYTLNLPTLGLSLEVTVKHPGTGELTNLDVPGLGTTILEAYVEVSGIHDGEPVTEFGVSEQLNSL